MPIDENDVNTSTRVPDDVAIENVGVATASASNWRKLLQEGKLSEASSAIGKEVSDIIERHKLINYSVLILHDQNGNIAHFDVNELYNAAVQSGRQQDILLIIHSRGGQIEPAYLISKSLKKLSKTKFVVVVPRKAKSAATLISLGADEIHMGPISELGPIDIQINGMPVLAVEDALHSIAHLVSKYPKSSEMFGQYLIKEAPIRSVGYLKRVGQSAQQYAERLLGAKPLGAGQDASTVADHLVNHYKDHGFVIDYDEALKMLGPGMIKSETSEYRAASEIQIFLESMHFALDHANKNWWYIGALKEGPYIYEKKVT